MSKDFDPSLKYRAKIAVANCDGRRILGADEMEPGSRPAQSNLPRRTVFRLELATSTMQELDQRIGNRITAESDNHGIGVITAGKGLYRWHITLGGGGLPDGDLSRLRELTEELNYALSDQVTDLLAGTQVSMNRLVLGKTLTLRATEPGAEVERARADIDTLVRTLGMAPDSYGDIFHLSAATVIGVSARENRARFIDGLTRGPVADVALKPIQLSFTGPIKAITLEDYAVIDRRSLLA